MKHSLILICASFIISSCSSSLKTANSRIDNSYKLELGILAEDKVDVFLNQLTQRYSFELARNEKTSNISGFYAETYLRERQPFLDEKREGIVIIFNKVIVKGDLIRNRTSTLSMTSVYYEIEVEIIQEGKMIDSEDILPFSFTEKGRNYAKDLAYDLKDLVRARIIQ